jgi:long-chain acyl-CoA synthetase
MSAAGSSAEQAFGTAAQPALNFLEDIFAQLHRAHGRVVLREIRGEQFKSVSASQLLELIERARACLRQAGLQPGDRCGLLGPNSTHWVAFNLALMAEGIIVVPLYLRQAPQELGAMLKDCGARALAASDRELGEAVTRGWRDAPARIFFGEALEKAYHPVAVEGVPIPRAEDEIAAIIYTSGTSGEPKGVCLSIANLNHMLSVTTEWTDQLMGQTNEPIRVFQYLPFNFAASWMVLLSCLSRETTLTLSTDLARLAHEIRLAAPNYFLNVPTLLERVRRNVEENLAKLPAPIRSLYAKARDAFERRQLGRSRAFDSLWLALARRLIFRKVRERFGPNLRALVCGSAPLAPDTQQFFLMLDIPVLQAYGLTETTGICTMDEAHRHGEPGFVGRAIPGIQMGLAENQEIIVRGANVFPRYWNRPEETANILRAGWLYTGDQGEVNARGNWRITGRIKNLIILNSGHNIAPEPIEEKIAHQLPLAQQVVVVGNGRGYLTALLVGPVDSEGAQSAIDRINRDLPHYRQVREFTVLRDAFTPENGLLTPNGKLRREAISARFASEIAAMYQQRAAAG